MSWGLDRALDAADQTLKNDSTIEEYTARAQALLAELKGGA